MDTKNVPNADVAIQAVLKAVSDAYADGYAAGRADAIQAIMKAATANVAVGIADRAPVETSAKDGRAPRGAVRVAVVKLLESRGDAGATTSEIVNSVHLFSEGAAISGVSASNELHRNKGKLYTQDAMGNWHLMSADADKEKAVDDGSGENPSTALSDQPEAQGREAGPGGVP
ncbi:hypothetical protein [Mesorhizobium sp.]|uniref:hypothetical protein n=1 Tax=Mesorhizobium sp. TaxID=1871066 RepID=UPI000FE71BB8|nr:hypothetical protein [Mesorhizobium sp.]RWM36602.1 MAG: hypothetical protein EOR75_22200 [Mesorhizobium sp.]TJV49391.1 MAG: hypothetical protein E5Y01_23550 [Mesorhizobium sp.]